MNNDRRLTGPPSACAQHQCIMCKSSKSAPQAPSSLKMEWKKNVLGLLLRCLYLVLSLGQGSPFPPFSEYQGIFSNKLSPNMLAVFSVLSWIPQSQQLIHFPMAIYLYWKECRIKRGGHCIIPTWPQGKSYALSLSETFSLSYDKSDIKNESYMCFRQHDVFIGTPR